MKRSRRTRIAAAHTAPVASSAAAVARGFVVSPATLAAGLAALVAALVVGFSAPTPAHADSVRKDQWQLRALDVHAAWQYAAGAGVTVAVLDSGVDSSHPDLAGQVLPGADFIDGSTDGRRDLVGHGTTVAALIAGRDDDSSGVVGIAPKAKILPVRVLDAQNKYDDAKVVADGVRWAVDRGARVINISLGGGARSDVLADALDYAAAHDVVVIACTGNTAPAMPAAEVWYPAREPGVVAVTGLATSNGGGGAADTTDENGGGSGGAAGGPAETLWSGSLTGRETVLAAPAANLLGARPGGYWRVQGTSFAAPLVTATAALVRSRWPDLDAANVVNRLIHTARDLGPAGRDDQYGFGQVNPLGALTDTVSPVNHNPLRSATTLGPANAARPPVTNRAGKRMPARPLPADPAPSLISTRLLVIVLLGALTFFLLLAGGAVALRRLHAAPTRQRPMWTSRPRQ